MEHRLALRVVQILEEVLGHGARNIVQNRAAGLPGLAQRRAARRGGFRFGAGAAGRG